jgi:dTDP-4-amino-4,6-dideoxygalactose transaminase
MKVPFLDLHANYLSIKAEVDEAVGRVIRESSFIGGSCVKGFEAAFAEYLQARHCIGVGNGTDALEIALEALELPPGSEVLVPANTFIASAEAVTRAGHRVVFCDCDPVTYTLSIPDAKRRITSATRAIVAVHLYGQPCDMEQIAALAAAHGLKVIEDCAQAHGAEYRGRKAGTLGDVAAFSFYPGKNLGAYGDGGAIVTNDASIATRCRMIANHGRIAKYDHEFEGRNSRLDGLQAAILSVKLRYLDQWTAARRDRAALYRDILKGSHIPAPEETDFGRHVYHLFVVQSDSREELRAQLAAAGVETGVHYPTVLPLLKAYAHLGHVPDDFPAAYAASQRILSLPLYPELGEDAIREVCRLLLSGGAAP